LVTHALEDNVADRRKFECHTSITPQQVFDEIKKWMK
jgi:hypothetical protein